MHCTEILRCPVCGAAMNREQGSLFCSGARRHCFDVAKEGYVNLAPAKAAGGGDDAALIRARTAFLEGGHYAPFAERLCTLLKKYLPQGGRVMDAGCGEGYYTRRVAREGFSVLGIDLSKNGIRYAAKAAKRENVAVDFAVASVFEPPVADGALDAVVSLFAPVAVEAFLRVLRPGGVLILGAAGPDHLLSLKRALYDTPYQNKERADAPEGVMERVMEERCAFDMDLSAPDLQALFAMTPYFYRTSREGHARLLALEHLSVNAEFDILIYRKPH